MEACGEVSSDIMLAYMHGELKYLPLAHDQCVEYVACDQIRGVTADVTPEQREEWFGDGTDELTGMLDKLAEISDEAQ